MSFDAGKIIATADLDRSPFQRSAAALRAEGRKLAQEKWNARVGLDTTGAERDADGFKTRMGTKFSRPTTAKVTADTTDALLKIKPLTDKLDEIQRKVATARVRLDGNDQAQRQLDQLDFGLRRVGLITSRPRVSLSGVETANLRLDELAAKLALVGRSSSRIAGGGSGGGILGTLSSLGGHAPSFKHLAIAGGLPLVAPVAGLAAGAASALLTPTVAAGIGGGLFAKTAASTYQQVSKDLKNLISLQAKYNAATSNKTRAAALAAEKKAWGALSPAEQKAVDTMQSLHDEWSKFQKDLHPQTFKLLSTGADIAAKGLKLLEPDVKAAGKAINSLASGADKALNDPFWQQFFGTFLPGQTHSALTVLGTDLGNVGTGLAHLTERFAPLGKDLENASVRWTSQFNKWTQGDGPGRFVDWVEKNGPTAAHDLEDIGKGIGGVLKSLAPLGQLELAAFGPILKFVGGFAQQHPKEVEALGAAYLSVAVGLKAISAVSGIASTAKAVGALFTALRNGKGLSGVGDVLKGGGGIGGCCCGPGGKEPVPGAPGTAGEGESTGSRLGRFIKGAPLAAIGTTGIAASAGAVGLSLGAAWVGSFKRAIDQVLGPQSGYQRQVNAAAAAKVAASGVNPRSPAGLYQTAQYVQHFGGRTGFAQGFTPSAPTAAQLQALKQYSNTQGDYLKITKQSAAAQQSFASAIDTYKAKLEAAGTPQSKINGLVATYAHTIKGIPPSVVTKVLADSSSAEAALKRLLALRQTLAQAVTLHAITPQTAGKVGAGPLSKAGGGMIAGPGTATSDSVPAWLSNGEFVMRASAVRHWGVGTLRHMNRYANGGGPIYNPGGQNPSPNAPTSTSSSSGSSSTPSSRRAAAAHRAAVARASANAIAGIVDFAGLTFLDDLKSTEHAIRSGIHQMINRLDNAVRDKYLKTDKSLVKQLRGTRGILVTLSQQELIVGKALSAATSTLQNLRGQAASVRSGTLSSYQGLGDVSQLTNVTSVGGILSVEGQQAKVARAFTHNLSALRKRGLSKEQYQELLAAGPGAAGNVVGLLAKASPAQIRALNKDTGLFTSLGHSVGTSSANYLFGGQIGAAQAEVKHDRALQHDLLHDQRRVAKALEQFVTANLQGDKGTHAALKGLREDLKSLPDNIGTAVGAVLDGKAKEATLRVRTHPTKRHH